MARPVAQLERTAVALRFMEEQDFEATGQLPAPYKPRRTRGLGKRAAVATMKCGWFVSKATGKGSWWLTKKAFAPGAPPQQHQRSESWRHGGPRITIIEIWDVAPATQILRVAAAIMMIAWAVSAGMN